MMYHFMKGLMMRDFVITADSNSDLLEKYIKRRILESFHTTMT